MRCSLRTLWRWLLLATTNASECVQECVDLGLHALALWVTRVVDDDVRGVNGERRHAFPFKH